MTITLTWEGPRSELSTMLMGLRSGTFSGLSTRCLTDPLLSQQHDSSPFVGNRASFLTGSRCRGKARERQEIAILDGSTLSDSKTSRLATQMIRLPPYIQITNQLHITLWRETGEILRAWVELSNYWISSPPLRNTVYQQHLIFCLSSL